MKKVLCYIGIFLVTACLLIGLLLGVAKIPRQMLYRNIYDSTEYFLERDAFPYVWEGVSPSKLDHYADCILLGISYYYDENDPVSSVIWSRYYEEAGRGEADSLQTGMEENLPANQEYLRYWHGSNIILRPLLLFFSVKQIYRLHAVVLFVLCLNLLFGFWHKKQKTLCYGFLAGGLLTSVWFAAFCLEYYWNFLIMLGISTLVVRFAGKQKQEMVLRLFLISGILTAFFDFLTTETVTLGVPLIIAVFLFSRTDRSFAGRRRMIYAGEAVLLWGTGYGLMWSLKWVLSAIVLKQNVWTYVAGHIEERVNGTKHSNILTEMGQALTQNLNKLLPAGFGGLWILAGVLLVISLVFVVYVYRRKNYDKDLIRLLLLIGLLPVARFLLLRGHSSAHAFFTFRALYTTIFAVITSAGLMLEKND